MEIKWVVEDETLFKGARNYCLTKIKDNSILSNEKTNWLNYFNQIY